MLNHIMACLDTASISEEIHCLETLTVSDIMEDMGITGGGVALVVLGFAYRWWKKRR